MTTCRSDPAGQLVLKRCCCWLMSKRAVSQMPNQFQKEWISLTQRHSEAASQGRELAVGDMALKYNTTRFLR